MFGVFVDTTRNVRCAWATPVYISAKVNRGGDKEKHHAAIHRMPVENAKMALMRHFTSPHVLLYASTAGLMCRFYFRKS